MSIESPASGRAFDTAPVPRAAQPEARTLYAGWADMDFNSLREEWFSRK
jgi:hypothetical protein